MTKMGMHILITIAILHSIDLCTCSTTTTTQNINDDHLDITQDIDAFKPDPNKHFESVLMNKLLGNYNHRARPVYNPNDTVEIELSMHIIKLQEVSTKFQFISVLGWVNVLWSDYRLQWDPHEYGGLDYVTMPASDIWLPTFVLANSASEQLYNELWYNVYKVKVMSDGSVKWSPGGIFKADCPIDVQYLPFDEQICQFRFENWVYMGDKVNLSLGHDAENKFLTFYAEENGEWEIIGVTSFRHDKYFWDLIPYPRVYFGIHLRRKSLFYITNIILLSMMLAVLVLFVFKLPAESGERVSMGVTLLLSFSVFILMINENIPDTSSAVPIIIVYLISFMALTTLGICESVFILYCYHHNGTHAPPYWVRFFFFKLIRCNRQSDKNMQDITEFQKGEDMYLNDDVSDNKVRNGERSRNESGSLRLKCRFCKERNTDENWNGEKNTLKKELQTPRECIEAWQSLSRDIDILCFWLFLITFLLLVFILLIFVPASFRQRSIEEAAATWRDT